MRRTGALTVAWLSLDVLFAAVFMAAVLLAAAPRSAHGQVPGSRARVEGVAAWVGGAGAGSGAFAILRSDVELRARMHVAGRTGRARLVSLPSALLRASLDELIGEVLIEREADRLHAALPSDADVQRERSRLQDESGGEGVLGLLLQALGASADEVDAMARRRAYVDAFLRANLEGGTAVSDTQLERVYASGEHPFAGRDLDTVREPLRAWVQQQVLARDVARWIEVLRSRTTVRILVEWSADG